MTQGTEIYCFHKKTSFSIFVKPCPVISLIIERDVGDGTSCNVT
jgi:hypothetical protein